MYGREFYYTFSVIEIVCTKSLYLFLYLMNVYSSNIIKWLLYMVTGMSLSGVTRSMYIRDKVMSIILYFFTNTFSCQICLFQFLLFKQCVLGI